MNKIGCSFFCCINYSQNIHFRNSCTFSNPSPLKHIPFRSFSLFYLYNIKTHRQKLCGFYRRVFYLDLSLLDFLILLFMILSYAPMKSLISSSTVPIPAIPKVSTNTFATFGDKNAGSVGPKWIFLTPRYNSARSTITAFCSYHAML